MTRNELTWNKGSTWYKYVCDDNVHNVLLTIAPTMMVSLVSRDSRFLCPRLRLVPLRDRDAWWLSSWSGSSWFFFLSHHHHHCEINLPEVMWTSENWKMWVNELITTLPSAELSWWAWCRRSRWWWGGVWSRRCRWRQCTPCESRRQIWPRQRHSWNFETLDVETWQRGYSGDKEHLWEASQLQEYITVVTAMVEPGQKRIQLLQQWSREIRFCSSATCTKTICN